MVTKQKLDRGEMKYTKSGKKKTLELLLIRAYVNYEKKDKPYFFLKTNFSCFQQVPKI